jgi:hypothetical protein
MILGTYWYFGFPAGLYEFEYFEFGPGYGGHADNPAELVTYVEVELPEKMIHDLRSLVDTYEEGYLFIYQDGRKMKIGTASHHLYDYDFLFMTEVDKLLKNEKIKKIEKQGFPHSKFIRIEKKRASGEDLYNYPGKKILQIVSSDRKKYNAENSFFRLDCNLNTSHKINFIADLKRISEHEGIKVMFYYDFEYKNVTNLILFFTNGRQGLNFSRKQLVNAVSFENKIEGTMLTYDVKPGHEGGYDFDFNNPGIELMVDREFIM